MDLRDSDGQAALDRFGIGDVAPEPAFDRLVALSTRLLRAPLAALTLLDGDRQFFKARKGLAGVESPREIAMGNQALLERDVFVVEDTRQDPRFSANPLVVGPPHLRFYASAPLRSAEGLCVGTFAVMDSAPRVLSEAEIATLRDLAAIAMDELELRKRSATQLQTASAMLEQNERHAADELAQAVERFELVSRATKDIIWDWNLASDQLFWSPNFYTQFGYSVADIAAGISGWAARIHDDDRGPVTSAIHEVIASGEKFWSAEYRFLRADGAYADVLDRGFVIHRDGKPVRMVGAMLDVSERKRHDRLQTALFAIADATTSSESFDTLFRRIHASINLLTSAPNLYVALYDPVAQTVEFPYSIDERGDGPSPPRPLRNGLTEYVLRTGEPVVLGDRAAFDKLTALGHIEQVGPPAESWVGVPLRTQEHVIGVLAAQVYSGSTRYGERDKELLQFVSTQVANAIERQRATEAVRASERKFRALIEHSADGIALLSATGHVLYRTPSVHRMIGGPDGLSMFDYLHPDEAAEVSESLRAIYTTPNTPIAVEARVRREDGAYRQIEAVCTNLIDDPAVRGVVVNLRDVTERKDMEARLMMADRMVSVGTLAAGVAHEINNPLAYVVANLSLATETVSRLATVPREVADALRDAHDGADRVRKIVADLKTFSRSDEERTGPVDMRRVLDASANLAWNEIRHRAKLVKDHAADLPPVRANEARLAQVFLNLLVNAAQAIPVGAADRNEIRIRTGVRDGRVFATVSDTGPGVPRELRSRIFDPFFTTKNVGEGTGLGLFICQNIVRALGGSITVANEPGRGAAFTVELPACAPEVSTPPPAPEPVAQARRGRILAIDDEPQLLSAIRRILAAHEVVGEDAPVRAVDRIVKGERFDVVLCDLMMPVMSGMDVFDAIRSVAPEQAARIVFMTGGAFTPASRLFLESVPNERLAKPFSPAALRTLIDERLRAAP